MIRRELTDAAIRRARNCLRAYPARARAYRIRQTIHLTVSTIRHRTVRKRLPCANCNFDLSAICHLIFGFVLPQPIYFANFAVICFVCRIYLYSGSRLQARRPAQAAAIPYAAAPYVHRAVHADAELTVCCCCICCTELYAVRQPLPCWCCCCCRQPYAVVKPPYLYATELILLICRCCCRKFVDLYSWFRFAVFCSDLNLQFVIWFDILPFWYLYLICRRIEFIESELTDMQPIPTDAVPCGDRAVHNRAVPPLWAVSVLYLPFDYNLADIWAVICIYLIFIYWLFIWFIDKLPILFIVIYCIIRSAMSDELLPNAIPLTSCYQFAVRPSPTAAGPKTIVVRWPLVFTDQPVRTAMQPVTGADIRRNRYPYRPMSDATICTATGAQTARNCNSDLRLSDTALIRWARYPRRYPVRRAHRPAADLIRISVYPIRHPSVRQSNRYPGFADLFIYRIELQQP